MVLFILSMLAPSLPLCGPAWEPKTLFSHTHTPSAGHPTGSAFNLYESDHTALGFPGGSVVKDPPANVGDAGLIPGWGRSPGEGNGNPLHYACLRNPMDRGAWWVTQSTGCKESDATEKLNNSNNAPHLLSILHHPAWLTSEASLDPPPPPLLPSLFLPLQGQNSPLRLRSNHTFVCVCSESSINVFTQSKNHYLLFLLRPHLLSLLVTPLLTYCPPHFGNTPGTWSPESTTGHFFQLLFS